MDDMTVRASPSGRGTEQAILQLKKGAHLLKCGRRGKPKFRPFRLSMDEKVLIWYSGEEEKHLKLNSISKIIPGQKTVNFLRQRQPEKELQSFSLIYQNGERSLDLICKDKEQAESWFLGLRALVSVSHNPKPLAYLKDSRRAHSCVNSPVGHIHRKYKPGLLNNSAKVSQVQSLHGSPPRPLIARYFPDSVVDIPDVFYSSRQRPFLDIQPFLDKMLPRLPNSKDKGSDLINEERMNVSAQINLSDQETPALDGTGALMDVFMWGNGIGGILSGGLQQCDMNGTKIDALLPKLLESTRMIDVKSISCGENHAALITKHGEVFCWGEEKGGRLGHKINMDMPYPKVVESLSRVCIEKITCGSQHTCAVSSSGELYAWGEGCNIGHSFPRRISSSLDGIYITKVACGEWHTAVVSSSGQLFTYGDGTFGVLGHGNLISLSQPKEVESLRGHRVIYVACGSWHTAAIVEIKSNASSAKLFTWGDGDGGRLGHADKDRKLLPTRVEPILDCDFAQVSCGRLITVALSLGGTVFTMGSSVNGQLGNPQAEDASITAVEGVLKGKVVKEISSGSSHVAVLTREGKVYTWGKGANGRLGLGDTNDRGSPTLVEGLEDRHVESVACGSSFTAAICLHKSMSGKDPSVCSGCGIVFGFTRKRHNCYNCGSILCHSCSNNKVINASLAPNKGKKFRVCDPCFRRLEKLPSKLSNQEEIKVVEGKTVTMQVLHQHSQDSISQYLGTTERWGKVPCPQRFSVSAASEKSLISGPRPREVSHARSRQSPSVSKFLLPRSTSLKEDLTQLDKMLKEELKRLHTEAMVLTRQCQSNSQKLQQYKCRIDEKWVVARDEAEKSKAAKDVIKVLKNQMNAASEKFLSGKETKCLRSLLDDNIPIYRPFTNQKDSSEPVDVKLIHRSTQPSHDVYIQEGNQPLPTSDAVTAHNNLQTGSDAVGLPKASKNDWVEQDERGVYITFTTLPSGQKGLKRVRFSRRHFGAKQAEEWWRKNQARVYVKYDISRIIPSSKDIREN